MDEINLVRPGFNSGWRDVMGPSSLTPLEPGSLVMLGDNAQYSDPELSWTGPVGPTDLHFYEGSHLGSAYRNDLFVGDVNTGSLYHFDLTSARRSLRLTGPLADYLVNNEGTLTSETDDILLGEGLGTITDILSGPGGMFVLSLTDGRLFRIQANPGAAPMSVMDVGATVMLPEPALGAMTVSLCAIALRLARRDRT
jgi:glucose/arabinose dehydrogenase